MGWGDPWVHPTRAQSAVVLGRKSTRASLCATTDWTNQPNPASVATSNREDPKTSEMGDVLAADGVETHVWNKRCALLKELGLPTLDRICVTLMESVAAEIGAEDEVADALDKGVESFEQVFDLVRDDPEKLKTVLASIAEVSPSEEADSTLSKLKAAISMHYLLTGGEKRAVPTNEGVEGVEGVEAQPAVKKAKTESETPEATPEEVGGESAAKETPEKLDGEETPTLA